MEVAHTDLATRRQVALERAGELVARADARSAVAWKSYHTLQTLTVALAAITPCLIFLAKDSPNNDVLSWLELFFPAVAAITAGASHIFHWREDGVRYTGLSEAIRSELWRYQTRAGDYRLSLTEEHALDHLVTRVDKLNLQTVAQWSADRLATAGDTAATPASAAPAGVAPQPASTTPPPAGASASQPAPR